MPGDLDFPELLHTPLYDRLRHDIHTAFSHGSEEICGLVDAYGELTPLVDRNRGADTGDCLDGGGIHAAVDYTPGCMVPGAKLKMSRDPGAAYLVQHQAMIDQPGACGW
jgi:hypothetical protein